MQYKKELTFERKFNNWVKLLLQDNIKICHKITITRMEWIRLATVGDS